MKSAGSRRSPNYCINNHNVNAIYAYQSEIIHTTPHTAYRSYLIAHISRTLDQINHTVATNAELTFTARLHDSFP